MCHRLIIIFAMLLGAAGDVAAADLGEQVYVATCANCHGSDGRGVSPSLTGLRVKPRDFTECRRTTPEPDHDWHAVIAEGGPARGFDRMMPAFGEVLSEAEQVAVLDYVRGFCPDPSWPAGDLNFPRPLITEKAYVEDEVIVTGAVDTRSPRNVDSSLIYEQRFLRRQMFEVIVPFGVVQGPDGAREAGIGDIAFALKSALVASKATGTILSLGAEAAFPTGNKDKGLGTGVTVLEPFLAFAQALPWESFIQIHTGADFLTKDTPGLENEAFLRAALGTTFAYRRFGRIITPMVEAITVRELTSGGITTVDLVPQLQVSLSRRQHVLASVGAVLPTVHRADRSPQVMAYLLWDWFDGGLFQGW